MWTYSPWALLPLFASGFSIAGFWLVYYMFLKEMWWDYRIFTRVPYDLPYIGLASSFPMSGCIFSAVMNVSAFLFFAIVVLRYRQLKSRTNLRCMNVSSVVVFFIAFVGMLISGNVPFRVNPDLNNYGSYMTFGLGMLYCWMQTYITRKSNTMKEGWLISTFRFLLSTSITVCLILYLYLMFQSFNRSAPRFQWSLVMLFFVFFGTFANEFSNYSFGIECKENSKPSISLALITTEVAKLVSRKAPEQV